MSHYIMHRGWMEHYAFKDEPYTEREAWCYLIEQASYKPHKIRYKSKVYEVDRGQAPTSIRKLTEKFKWGINRVRGFLALLENEGMITKKTDTGFMIISICNYERFQTVLRKSDTHSDTVTDTHSDTLTDTVTDTNRKKGKEGEIKGKRESAHEDAPLPPKKSKPKTQATKLSEDWQLPVPLGQWACDEFKVKPDAVRAVAAIFKDYWIGKGEAMADWPATWRNWCRRQDWQKLEVKQPKPYWGG